MHTGRDNYQGGIGIAHFPQRRMDAALLLFIRSLTPLVYILLPILSSYFKFSRTTIQQPKNHTLTTTQTSKLITTLAIDAHGLFTAIGLAY